MKDWKKWKEELVLLNYVKIPRRYFHSSFPTNALLQLHHFSDVSEIGHGTVSYLRKQAEDGTVQCSFIMVKSH